jgi:hypothetical protein
MVEKILIGIAIGLILAIIYVIGTMSIGKLNIEQAASKYIFDVWYLWVPLAIVIFWLSIIEYNRKKRSLKINSMYEDICKKIDDFQFQRDVYTKHPNIPFPIQIEKLYQWFPRENKNCLKACWKRLQEKKRIYWDQGMWVIKQGK